MKRIPATACFFLFAVFSWAQRDSIGPDRTEGVASQQTNAIPPSRAHHALVYEEEKKMIVLTAGSTPTDSGKSYTFYNDLWVFDGQQWNQLNNAGD